MNLDHTILDHTFLDQHYFRSTSLNAVQID